MGRRGRRLCRRGRHRGKLTGFFRGKARQLTALVNPSPQDISPRIATNKPQTGGIIAYRDNKRKPWGQAYRAHRPWPDVLLCFRCNVEKPLSEMCADNRSGIGVRQLCRACERERKREERASLKERSMARQPGRLPTELGDAIDRRVKVSAAREARLAARAAQRRAPETLAPGLASSAGPHPDPKRFWNPGGPQARNSGRWTPEDGRPRDWALR